MSAAAKILFIDRDGTLIEEPDDNQVDRLEKVQLLPGVIPALLQLGKHGFRFVMVSNQDGLGTTTFPRADFDACQAFILRLFATQGIVFDEVFICPHTAADGCDCRKPRTGLLTRFLAATNLNAELSAVIGDRATDLELAARIGVRGLLVGSGNQTVNWSDIVEQLCYSDRAALAERTTKETRISASVNLDSAGRIEVHTGIGFYDHMLEQIAKHGGFSLALHCDGDTHIDEHHTVEDSAICLGTAVREALGNKVGVARYGFLLPMDESEAKVSIDLSGRSAFRFAADFPRENVGQLSTEMVEHFFRSFAESLGAALHIEVNGSNTHHMIEACFKSVGRALRLAVAQSGSEMPSTKGMLS